MRILIIGVNYAPEPTGNAPYTTALARSLARRGHEVRVLTSYPHYPQWRIPEEWAGRRMTQEIDGVVVHRVRPRIPARGGTGLGRLVMEMHFGVLAATTPWPRPDVVLAVSPALFGSALPLLRARLTPRLNAGLWVQDLYSKGAEELSGSLSHAASALAAAESAVLRLARSVSVIHPRFARHATEGLRIPAGHVVVNRNWSHLVRVSGAVDRDRVRAEHGWAPDETVLLHAGNMGAKQGLDNVVEAARETQRRGERVRWVLMGSGSQHEQLERMGRGIPTLQMLPPQDDQRYQELMRSADVLVVNEKPGLREMAVPSKLTSYFRAGLPVLGAVESDGTTAAEIDSAGAGVVVPPGEPARLLQAALELRADPERCRRLGASGARHAREHLDEEAAVDRYESWLAALARIPLQRRPAAVVHAPSPAGAPAPADTPARGPGRVRAGLIEERS